MRKSLVSDLFGIPIICIRLPDPALHGNPIYRRRTWRCAPSILSAALPVHIMTSIPENTSMKQETGKYLKKRSHFWCVSYIFISQLQIWKTRLHEPGINRFSIQTYSLFFNQYLIKFCKCQITIRQDILYLNIFFATLNFYSVLRSALWQSEL